MGSKYTSEMIDYLKEIAKGRYLDEVKELMETKFPHIEWKKQAIADLKRKNNIKSGLTKKKLIYTQDMISEVRFLNGDYTTAEIVTAMNKQFPEIEWNQSKIKYIRRIHNIKSSVNITSNIDVFGEKMMPIIRSLEDNYGTLTKVPEDDEQLQEVRILGNYMGVN